MSKKAKKQPKNIAEPILGAYMECRVYLCAAYSSSKKFRLLVYSGTPIESVQACDASLFSTPLDQQLPEEWVPFHVECISGRSRGEVLNDIFRSFGCTFGINEHTKPILSELQKHCEITLYEFEVDFDRICSCIGEYVLFRLIENPSEWGRGGLKYRGVFELVDSYNRDARERDNKYYCVRIDFSDCDSRLSQEFHQKFSNLSFVSHCVSEFTQSLHIPLSGVFAVIAMKLHQTHRWPSCGMMENPFSAHHYWQLVERYISVLLLKHGYTQCARVAWQELRHLYRNWPERYRICCFPAKVFVWPDEPDAMGHLVPNIIEEGSDPEAYERLQHSKEAIYFSFEQ